MRDADRLFEAFTTIANHQAHRLAHPADDFGWPRCDCEACTAKTNRMNAAFIDTILRGDGDPERTIDRNPQSEFDYDGDNGRGHSEEMHANHPWAPTAGPLGGWKQLAEALPHIAAPSIVPMADADAVVTDTVTELPNEVAFDLSLYSEEPETGD